MTSHSKPRKPREVTEENIQRWAKDKRSGIYGELSRIITEQRRIIDGEATSRATICQMFRREEAFRIAAELDRDGYRRWWFAWPLVNSWFSAGYRRWWILWPLIKRLR